LPGRSDLDLMVAAAQEAGDLALRFWRQTPQSWEKPDGAGPVTEADLAVDTLLRDRLTSARPEYGWLSEETPDSAARLDKPCVFIVDPIDGTRAFMNEEPSWALSLAVAQAGHITAAVVALPARGQVFTAAQGQGAFLNGGRLAPKPRLDLNGARILAAKPNFAPQHWGGKNLPVEHHFRSSLAYRMSLVAEGRFDAALSLRGCWEWDIAAGDLIAREAGQISTDMHGKGFVFNNPHPNLPGMIAASPYVHQSLMAQITPPMARPLYLPQ
jgi:myo-inositol-1(or 4)-monophosphatase